MVEPNHYWIERECHNDDARHSMNEEHMRKRRLHRYAADDHQSMNKTKTVHVDNALEEQII